MKYLHKISFNSDVDLDINEEIHGIMNKRLNELQQYTFSSKVTEDDQFSITYIAILIPTRNFHVISIVDKFTECNNLSINIVGTTECEEKHQGTVLLCDFWYLENGDIYYEIIDDFIAQYGTEDPSTFDDLLIDNRLISKIIYKCVNFYVNKRVMYMKSNKRSDDYYLEMD